MPPYLQRLIAPVAIPSVLRILAGFEALIFILMKILGPARSAQFLDVLALDFGQVLRGQVWRLVSFIAIPPADPFSNLGLLWLVFAVMFLFLVNDILESAWGVNALNVFFYAGFAGCIAASILLWAVHPDLQGMLAFALPAYFGSACVMAAGTVAPKVEIRLMFFIPVPLGLVAVISGLFILQAVVSLFMVSALLGLVPLLCILPYLIWVLPLAFRSAGQVVATRERRARFEKARGSGAAAFHNCEACGATDASHPEREFRVTAEGHEKCDACLDSGKNS